MGSLGSPWSMVHRVRDEAGWAAVTAGAHPVCAHFGADWAPPCAAVDAALAGLAEDLPAVAFVRVDADAEGAAELCERMGVDAVPTCVFLRDGKAQGSLEGADVPALVGRVRKEFQGAAGAAPRPAGAIAAAAPAAAAEGGAAWAPRPAEAAETREQLEARIRGLIGTQGVTLFMKGTPDAPRCGFSRKVVEWLRADGVVGFRHFDILGDDAVRQGLKELSNWPTFPQLYADGELVGGCDIVEELHEAGELASECKVVPVAGGDKPPLADRLAALVRKEKVMLFMKGTPDAPRCGFSRKVVEWLGHVGVEGYGTFDILSDEEVRQGLKEYSNWPTYPQLYVDGELVGGCDIIEELYDTQELAAACGVGA